MNSGRRPNSVPRRKLLKHKKRRSAPIKPVPTSLIDPGPLTDEENFSHDKSTSDPGSSADGTFPFSSRTDFTVNLHDYTTPDVNPNLETKEPTPQTKEHILNLLMEVKKKLKLCLGHRWVPVVREDSLHVLFLSTESNITVQRSLVFFPDGIVQLFIHCKEFNLQSILHEADPPLPLESGSINYFVDRAAGMVAKVNVMEVCSGYDDDRYKVAWRSCPLGIIDRNPYRECRYSETFRSFSCLLLVQRRKWQCPECTKLYGPLKRRSHAVNVEEPSPFAANVYLTEDQKLKKLKAQQEKLAANRKTIARLQAKMQELIAKQGVEIDNQLSNHLTDILGQSNLTPAQAIFLQQQVKASQKKNMAGMRWHPTLIRLALSLQIASPSAYEIARDTGMIKLLSRRTLFDYSRAQTIKEGIDVSVLESMARKTEKLVEEAPYKKFDVLMADEMHISQNLVYQKSSGRLMGFTSLDTVDQEIFLLEQYLQNHSEIDEEISPPVAKKVLVYMAKGVSSGLKGAVASFAVNNISATQMYTWTWEVVGALERSGVAVIAFAGDGCSINRKFIKMHEPVTRLWSGVIFDTKYKAARYRTLYFLSDVPHLLKTIRNNMLNSRSYKKKSIRRMVYKRKRITWDYIIRLYNEKKGKLFRKAYKLNVMNVFPDCYSRMKVKYAAEVLSRTVAQDLEDQPWGGKASETINFLRRVNDWFDCLNGAFSTLGHRKRNNDLNPYTSTSDQRLSTEGPLESFLDYLEDWKSDALQTPLTQLCDDTAGSDVLNHETIVGQDDSIAASEEGVDHDSEETPASKRLLSYQTLEGIEQTTRAFLDMVPWLLRQGTKFINARVFTQDPLEQHFSKVRAGQGGSTNPNLGQVLSRNRALHLIGELGMKSRRANVEEGMNIVEVSSEPLPKRKRTLPLVRVDF